MSIFKPGQRYISIHEPELGIGRVLAVQNKTSFLSFLLLDKVEFIEIMLLP